MTIRLMTVIMSPPSFCPLYSVEKPHIVCLAKKILNFMSSVTTLLEKWEAILEEKKVIAMGIYCLIITQGDKEEITPQSNQYAIQKREN